MEGILGNFVKTFVLDILFDAFFCLIIAFLLAVLSNDNSVHTGEIFLFIFLGQYAFLFLLWVKNSLSNWVAFLLYKKSGISKKIFNSLKDKKLPPPEFYETSDEYFSRLLSNETTDITVQQKIDCALEIGHISYMRAHYKLQETLMFEKAFKEAAERYKQTFKD